ncbi:DUF2079 domain-containing protein [Actinomadura kijaniata]|uniref:Putative membrane protein n=1 Tax=Actinomadura namibiensis TaxID=182080 RepID=A0A7W3QJZ2_ACTNM|nr:DUF2079 domain-containing protein [Actinomadura namibiensis]MBA8949900.1 putative membrane protein [Actinomadura namibiensis]
MSGDETAVAEGPPAASPGGGAAAPGRPGPGGRPHARLPVAVAALFAALYCVHSLMRHALLRSTGYDLGIFEQAVRGYAEFRAPIVPLKEPGFHLLGDHFHPWLAALGPLYRLWPDARLLLVVQAVLIAVSVVPVGRLAIDRLGVRSGVAVMVAYGLSFGLQGAVAFDFHEIALAVPLLAFAMVALAEERWRAAALWTLPVLLVKEDMGLVVAAVGVYLLLRRRWRLGAAMLGGGFAAIAVIVLVLIPLWNPKGYAYFGSVSGGGMVHGSPGAGGDLLGTLLGFPASLVEHPQKLWLLWMLGVVTAFAALRSPITLIALPVVGYRLVSTISLHWSTERVHYNAILMPILFVALVDAVVRMRGGARRPVRTYARFAVPAALAVSLVSLPGTEFGKMFSPSFWTTTPHVTAARQVLAMVPDDARVAASNFLAPQLTGRAEVVLFPNVTRAPVDWVVVDTRRPSVVPVPPAEIPAAIAALPGQGFRLVADRDGVQLWHRPGR